jgi:hypothetical protein
VTSREILGWVTTGNRPITESVPRNQFVAVVLGDNWLPALAVLVPGHACVAPKNAPEDEIIKRARGWLRDAGQASG